MSGHNPPHGRLGQPNTTWSPLQVPSYVPRQPQLAHMSSERSMARSPLTWPAPPTTHQDKMYSLMSGNMMNNIEMNPLLQGYGRNVSMPLGSVDLTLSSAARSTPSPKGAHNNAQAAATSTPTTSHSSHTSSSSTTLPSNNIPTSGHSFTSDGGGHAGRYSVERQSETKHHIVMRSISSFSNHPARASPSSGGVIQSTTVAALKERMQGMGTCLTPSGGAGSTSNSFGITNTINDGSNSMLGAGIMRGGNGFGTGLNNRTANDLAALVSGSLLVKDAKQINSEMDGKNGRDCCPVFDTPPKFSHLGCTDSADLVKEFVLQTMHCNALSVSPKRTRSSVQTALSPSRSRSPPLNLLLGSSAIDGKVGVDCLNSAFPLQTGNTSVPLSLNSADSAATGIEGTDVGSVAARAIGLLAGSSELSAGVPTLPSSCTLNPSASPTGNSMASSEDSIDSSNSRSNAARRRRKPEKTNKMNAAFPAEEGKSLFPSVKPIDGGTSSLIEELDSLRSNHTARNDITALAIEGINALSHGLAGAQCDLSQPPPSSESSSMVNAPENPNAPLLPHDIFLPHHHSQRKVAAPLVEVSQDQQKLLESLIQSNMNSSNSTALATNSSSCATAGLPSVSGVEGTHLSTASGLQKSVANDCETIDKIAAMVSATTAMASKYFADKVGEVTNENGIGERTLANASSMNCNGPAPLPVKDVPDGGNSDHKADANKDTNNPDSSYEEVENKLEEMFAGIEEQSEKCAEPVLKRESDNGNETLAVASNESIPDDNKTKNVSDSSEVMKQLSSDNPAGSGSGKKPLTPAQKRSNGQSKAATGEMVTSTPAATKRKRGPKKKTSGKLSSPFMEPEGPAMLGLKALSGKKKGKAGKGATAAGTGKKGKGAKGKQGAGSKKDDRESSTSGGGWSVGNTSSSIEASGKCKGPYVQVKANGSHTVINTPINEEDGEKPQNKVKKFGNSLNSSERSKIRGLHVSTLSTKYDADTTDTTWMCVFCKTGPHKFRLGDLFGPYIISTASCEYEQSQVDVDFFSVRRTRDDLESKQAKQKRAADKLKEQQQSGPKSKKRKNATGTATPAGMLSPVAGPSNSKTVALKQEPFEDGLERAKQQPASEIFYGMIKASDNTYEVWTHEDCLVWAPGVYMVGTRIVGLEAAIWNCCRHQCELCQNYGAVLNCLHQGCHAKAHFICAHKQNWKLTEDFQSFCERHTQKEECGDAVMPVATKVEEVVAAAAVAAPVATKQNKKEVKSSKETTSLSTCAS
uniref:PHD-type domain-containing protein n=1 Tax=Anopheles epiroticus TaxID=199890 RepID=A0A182PQ91_9DIPT